MLVPVLLVEKASKTFLLHWYDSFCVLYVGILPRESHTGWKNFLIPTPHYSVNKLYFLFYFFKQQVPQQPSGVGPWAAPAQNFGMLPTSVPSTVGVVRPMGQQQVAGMTPPVYMGVGQMPRMPFQAMSPGAMSMAPRPGPVSMGTSSLAMPTTGLAARGNLPAAGSRRAGEEMRAPNALDLLGQEVLQNQKQQQKQKQTVTPLQEKAVPEQQQASASTTDSLLSLGLEPSPATLPAGAMNVGSPSAASFLPVASPPKPAAPVSLDNVFVPLDTITPG